MKERRKNDERTTKEVQSSNWNVAYCGKIAVISLFHRSSYCFLFSTLFFSFFSFSSASFSSLFFLFSFIQLFVFHIESNGIRTWWKAVESIYRWILVAASQRCISTRPASAAAAGAAVVLFYFVMELAKETPSWKVNSRRPPSGSDLNEFTPPSPSRIRNRSIDPSIREMAESFISIFANTVRNSRMTWNSTSHGLFPTLD